MRQIRDDAGVEWMVYAVNPAASEWRAVGSLPEVYRNGWLCFECPTEKRRLTPLPSGWEDLPIEQLSTLLGTAVQVRRAAQHSS
jgi:hypothetical protein